MQKLLLIAVALLATAGSVAAQDQRVVSAMQARQDFIPLGKTGLGGRQFHYYLLAGELSVPRASPSAGTARYAILLNIRGPENSQIVEAGAISCEDMTVGALYRLALDQNGKERDTSGPVTKAGSTVMPPEAAAMLGDFLCKGKLPATRLAGKTLADFR
jgi:hypothetical protein